MKLLLTLATLLLFSGLTTAEEEIPPGLVAHVDDNTDRIVELEAFRANAETLFAAIQLAAVELRSRADIIESDIGTLFAIPVSERVVDANDTFVGLWSRRNETVSIPIADGIGFTGVRQNAFLSKTLWYTTDDCTGTAYSDNRETGLVTTSGVLAGPIPKLYVGATGPDGLFLPTTPVGPGLDIGSFWQYSQGAVAWSCISTITTRDDMSTATLEVDINDFALPFVLKFL